MEELKRRQDETDEPHAARDTVIRSDLKGYQVKDAKKFIFLSIEHKYGSSSPRR